MYGNPVNYYVEKEISKQKKELAGSKLETEILKKVISIFPRKTVQICILRES